MSKRRPIADAGRDQQHAVGSTPDPMHRLVTLLYPKSQASESSRALRTNVEFASIDVPITSLLVTSSVPGEGKTTVAANLAISFAQAGRRTVLIDADLRHPEIHTLFKRGNEIGLTTLLRSDPGDVARALQGTDQANLSIITSGPVPPNPAELLGSQKMRAIIENLKQNEDVPGLRQSSAALCDRRGGPGAGRGRHPSDHQRRTNTACGRTTRSGGTRPCRGADDRNDANRVRSEMARPTAERNPRPAPMLQIPGRLVPPTRAQGRQA